MKMEENKKNTGFIVATIILAILVIGLMGYIVYDKMSNNNDKNQGNDIEDVTHKENNEQSLKEIDINSDLVKNLIYPMNSMGTEGYEWSYQNETFDTLGRLHRMQDAAYRISPDEEDLNKNQVFYKAENVKESYKKIYGPDSSYTDGDLKDSLNTCFVISNYDSTLKMYIEETGCGFDSLKSVKRVSKKYKAEQNNDYLYVYEYIQSVVVRPESLDNIEKTVVYLLDHDDQETKQIDYKDYENTIYDMINKDEVDTYKWVFKKQSDGNYYFYSGTWEN